MGKEVKEKEGVGFCLMVEGVVDGFVLGRGRASGSSGA